LPKIITVNPILEIPVFGFEPPPTLVVDSGDRRELIEVASVFYGLTECHDVRPTIVDCDITKLGISYGSSVRIILGLRRADDACLPFLLPALALITPPDHPQSFPLFEVRVCSGI
jgi:hypothetical protein